MHGATTQGIAKLLEHGDYITRTANKQQRVLSTTTIANTHWHWLACPVDILENTIKSHRTWNSISKYTFSQKALVKAIYLLRINFVLKPEKTHVWHYKDNDTTDHDMAYFHRHMYIIPTWRKISAFARWTVKSLKHSTRPKAIFADSKLHRSVNSEIRQDMTLPAYSAVLRFKSAHIIPRSS